MILNPDHRAAFDTNTRRTELTTEVKRDAARQAVTFDDIRRSVPSLRDLSDGEITTVAQSAGLEVISGAPRNRG